MLMGCCDDDDAVDADADGVLMGYDDADADALMGFCDGDAEADADAVLR